MQVRHSSLFWPSGCESGEEEEAVVRETRRVLEQQGQTGGGVSAGLKGWRRGRGEERGIVGDILGFRVRTYREA